MFSYFSSMNATKALELYKTERNGHLDQLRQLKIRDLVPTEEELAANEIFKRIVQEATKTVPENCHFRPFCHEKEMQETKLYKLFTQMPKASLHHIHGDAILSGEWFVKRTYDPDLWYHDRMFTITRAKEMKGVKGDGWIRIEDERSRAVSKEAFDNYLLSYFQLDTKVWHDDLWRDFLGNLENRSHIMTEWKHAEDYFDDVFKMAIEEGYTNYQIKIMYNWFKDENGETIDNDREIAMYKKCIEKAQKIDPAFTVGLIYESYRHWDREKLMKYLDDCYESKKKYPDLIIGYDMVGDEFRVETYSDSDYLMENIYKQKKDGVHFPFVFHTGETVIQGNTNVLDTLMLENCARLGHAINLCKYPHLYDTVKKKNICIEVQPTANVALQKMRDLRMHPACSYHNLGIRTSVSTDAPGINGSNANWEWFVVAFSFEWDLIEVKRALIDSIECSLMPERTIHEMREEFEKRWKVFLGKIHEIAENRP